MTDSVASAAGRKFLLPPWRNYDALKPPETGLCTHYPEIKSETALKYTSYMETVIFIFHCETLSLFLRFWLLVGWEFLWYSGALSKLWSGNGIGTGYLHLVAFTTLWWYKPGTLIMKTQGCGCYRVNTNISHPFVELFFYFPIWCKCLTTVEWSTFSSSATSRVVLRGFASIKALSWLSSIAEERLRPYQSSRLSSALRNVLNQCWTVTFFDGPLVNARLICE
jgi:hypothetical protein